MSCSSNRKPRKSRKQAPLFIETPTGPIAAVARNCTCPHPLCGECALGGCSRQCDVCQPNPNASPVPAPAVVEAPTPEPTPAPAPDANKPAKPNLALAEARQAILAALKAGSKDRSALKAMVPFGNYTALMRGLETDGLVKAEKAGGKWGYTLTAKGKKA